jgi:LytR cell envelope-related transcriptional attenuator
VLTLIDNVGVYVAFPALLGILLLVPLYLSQRRDLIRLRAWMEQDPRHPATDVAASEALLDRTEAELEKLLAARGEPVHAPTAPAVAPARAAGTASAAGAVGPATVEAPAAPAAPPPPARPAEAPGGAVGTPMTPIPAARRVTAERPALTRITMERAALEPHPRWRRFAGRITRPRVLALIALVAVTIGVGALIGSRALTEHGTAGGKRQHRHGALAPGHITVSVLNGTAVPGLAAKVSETIHENGFKRGTIGTSRKQYQQTVVMFGGGEKRAAERVAHVLGVTPVQRIDRVTRAVAGSADVAVIAGADRVQG